MNKPNRSSRTDRQAHVNTSRADRERSLDALQLLERRAGNAGPGREHEWAADVRASIVVLEHALRRQQENAAPDESLLTAIEREEPRLRHRVEELRQRYGAIQDELATLHAQLDVTERAATCDVADARQRLERLANELRYQRAREADIVYEAYSVDLGEGD